MEINGELVLQIRNAIKKTNSHINSGFWSIDKHSIESVFINFLKKEVTRETLVHTNKDGSKTGIYYQLKYIKPINVALFADADNNIKQIVIFPLRGRVGEDLINLLEHHISEIDMNSIKEDYDTSNFYRGFTNLINNIEKFSFTN